MQRSNPGVANTNHLSQDKSINSPTFEFTQWSRVLLAADPAANGSEKALQQLCQIYWYPLYAFVRSSGYSPEDAEDMTQAFFARLLEKNYLSSADREKGRFRSFLIVALKRFLANDWERKHAAKRGGFSAFVSIDREYAESLYGGMELSHEEQPDVLLEKQWAITLIGHVMERLKTEYHDSGRGELFGLLRLSLTREDSAIGYAEIASRLDTSTAAVKMAAMRLRERYQSLLHEEIARTVESPDEIDDEICYLFDVLSR